MKKNKLQKRARKAAVKYLETAGYEVEERDHMGFIVAWDAGALVFLILEVGTGSFPELGEDRETFEDAMMLYLLTNDVVDVPIRRDKLVMRVAGSDKAAIRHEVHVC